MTNHSPDTKDSGWVEGKVTAFQLQALISIQKM